MGKLEKDKDGNPVIVVPFHIRHLGPRQSIVLDCGSKFNDVVNEPLPKSIILAHQYAQMLESGRYSTVLELAKALKLDRSYVARTLSLVNLAPDIIVAVMQGKTPPEMTLAKAVNTPLRRFVTEVIIISRSKFLVVDRFSI